MPRAKTERVKTLKKKLIERIESDYCKPGDRFFSNRYIAQRFKVSYQTAHRIMKELTEEGYIEMRPASGAYISGPQRKLHGVTWYVRSRARRKESFGERLIGLFSAYLEKQTIPFSIVFVDEDEEVAIEPDTYPVLWETNQLLGQIVEQNRYCLLLNARPQPGIASTFVDSITIDDFSGGVAAGELFEQLKTVRCPAVISGPHDDPRNIARERGFLSRYPDAMVFRAESWYFDPGYVQASLLFLRDRDAVFCCNDRLASAVATFVRDSGRSPIPLIGFDDAPISEELNITTIAIPWDELVSLGGEIIKKRITGDSNSTIHYVLVTRPVIRGGFTMYASH